MVQMTCFLFNSCPALERDRADGNSSQDKEWPGLKGSPLLRICGWVVRAGISQIVHLSRQPEKFRINSLISKVSSPKKFINTQ